MLESSRIYQDDYASIIAGPEYDVEVASSSDEEDRETQGGGECRGSGMPGRNSRKNQHMGSGQGGASKGQPIKAPNIKGHGTNNAAHKSR